ncbi:MarR family winged helix-turn-helix transcriptional regulator [Ulvibacterium sp.]|uniref:MarR family winged helix-turn-helix transcriptional regulator n=1 Tax=Ulvibacterium sp. TaxID=2665914 RepID=UPI003CC58C90
METFDPEYQNQNIEGKIVVALERISEAFKVLLWQKGKENQLTPIQLQILLFVNFHLPEKCKVNYLAKEFNVTKATISESIRLLLKKELILKETDPADTRSFFIYLTERGKATLQRTSSFAHPIEKPIHSFPEEQKRILFQSLLQLIEKLNKADVVNVQRMCTSCRFYESGSENDYCRLLEKKLHQADLRIDCPEHQTVL